jgi:hypothetical protein
MRPRQVSFALRASDRPAVRHTRGRLNIGKNAANRLLGVVKSCEPLRVCESQPAVRGGARRTTEPSVSILNPNSHARLEIRRLSLPIETEAKRIAIMIADHPFGLPGANTPSGRSPVTTALVAASANSGKPY